jgi:high-affinity Fe2+/Pb2+ permease
MSDTDLSATPGTPQTPAKAMAGTILTLVSTFVLAWIADDNGVNSQDVIGWVVSALVAAGLVGGTVFQVKNRAKYRSNSNLRAGSADR